MAFTFSPSLDSDLDTVRFNINDITFQSGPLPDGENVADETIDALLTSEGNATCATAALFDYLAAAWRNKPVFGPGELSTIHVNVAAGYEREAVKWRARCEATSGDDGLVSYSPRVGATAVTRVDSFSEAAAATEYAFDD
jgi:hypothetical protein